MRIREPVPEDAADLGEVQVRSRQAGYTGGLLPQDALDALDPDDRAARWAAGLARPARPRTVRLVAEVDDRVVGFLVAGPRDGAPDALRGEVYAVNVHPDAWGTGVGRALLAAGLEALAAAGFSVVLQWVHRDNLRARRFYERQGWVEDGTERLEEVLGVEVPEVRYRLHLQRPDGT